jgi:simple sugar transport system ATP-binding protein
LVGVDITRLSDAQVRAQGLAIIPEDRQEEGLLMDRSLRENFILGLQRDPRYSSLGLLRSRPIQDAVTSALEDHDVRPRNPDAHARGLSGGNQQKLVIAREFSRNPKFLIASQPTRGVDVGAIESIHARILKAREEGAAVLLLSSELDEVMALSDRVLVIYEGKIVAEHVRRTGMQPFDEKAIGLGMSGVTS